MSNIRSMQYSLFKPQSWEKDGKYNGAAFSWKLWRTDNGPVFMMEGVKQKGWNKETRTGSFYNSKDNPDQSFRVKFNVVELGGLLLAIRKFESYNTFHTFDDDKTSIDFKATVAKAKKEGEKDRDVFSLTVKRNGVPFGLGIELGEAEALSVFIETAMQEIFYASTQNKGE